MTTPSMAEVCAPVSTVDTKVCTKCREEKLLADFNRHKSTADGRQTYCRECNKAYQAKWRIENPAYQAAWRDRHQGYHLEYHRQWRIDNPDQWSGHNRARSARKRAHGKGATGKEVNEWLKKQILVCYWCGTNCRKRYEIDHYVPLAKGGRHDLSNFVISCPRCNSKKKAKDPYEYAASIGRLF